MILIVHTTHYRKGSPQFAIVAQTLLTEIATRYSGEIELRGIWGKRDLTALFERIASSGKKLDEFHFVGHSGMYGPMYGTVEYPEQYSPYEWKQLAIPFAENTEAYFHCCRSARWFAPFFARVFGVKTYGYHWYTAFSSDKTYYKRIAAGTTSMYAAGCVGKKSHGWTGAIRKHSGKCRLEEMKAFLPQPPDADTTYNKVAHLYDAVFQDIKVRRDEWNWMDKHFGDLKGKTVIDIGCGNGALLKELAPRIEKGYGLDISAGILEKARNMHAHNPHIAFMQLDGPRLLLADQSADVVVSLLSFRYLDWDPLMDEIRRVLRPGGKIIIVDMVTVPVSWKEFPLLLRSKLRHYRERMQNRAFYDNLNRLVQHPDWKSMLAYNPIRAEHEMKWYLESRFPGKKPEKINVGWNAAILAFDSGEIERMEDIHLTYP